MHSDLPPLTWLRAFEAAARTLSFTNAATELHVTQAAVSKHVKSLELHLRHQLFRRRPRSLELTKSGEAYLPKVQDALERLAIGTREVFGHRQAPGLTLRCAVSFAVNWLAPRLPEFLERHPGTSVRVISSVWNDPFDKDAFDLDIQYGTGDWPGYVSHRLTNEAITPLCAPDLASRIPLRKPDDLGRHRLLHVLGYQEGWGIWLNAVGAKAVDPGKGLQLDNSLMAFEIAAEGGGVALGRTSLAERDLALGRLVAPFALNVPIAEGFHLLRPEAGNSHPDALAFVDWITSKV
ncbi:LysR substrate-binding domain-containing protein [Tabrizicola sp.]|uniref:LysR substrate-binding domain-containing protein n=1 Tax=Tabrizicola sp. TaxID=2005166 RepID=UPI003F2CA880